MCLIRPPATSNANTVTVTPSCWATRPGWPFDHTLQDCHVECYADDRGVEARDLLAASDGAQGGGDESAAIGGSRWLRVEDTDEGADVPGFPGLLKSLTRLARRAGEAAAAREARTRRPADVASWRQAAGLRPVISATSVKR